MAGSRGVGALLVVGTEDEDGDRLSVGAALTVGTIDTVGKGLGQAEGPPVTVGPVEMDG